MIIRNEIERVVVCFTDSSAVIKRKRAAGYAANPAPLFAAVITRRKISSRSNAGGLQRWGPWRAGSGLPDDAIDEIAMPPLRKAVFAMLS